MFCDLNKSVATKLSKSKFSLCLACTILRAFGSPADRLLWYRNLKDKMNEDRHLKVWGQRTNNALSKLEKTFKPKKVLRQSMR